MKDCVLRGMPTCCDGCLAVPATSLEPVPVLAPALPFPALLALVRASVPGHSSRSCCRCFYYCCCCSEGCCDCSGNSCCAHRRTPAVPANRPLCWHACYYHHHHYHQRHRQRRFVCSGFCRLGWTADPASRWHHWPWRAAACGLLRQVDAPRTRCDG